MLPLNICELFVVSQFLLVVAFSDLKSVAGDEEDGEGKSVQGLNILGGELRSPEKVKKHLRAFSKVSLLF